MKFDTSDWQPFNFEEIIDKIYKAKAYAKIELTISTDKKRGFLPFVSRTDTNNSVDCYVLSSDLDKIEDGNAITIGDTTSTISYQPEAFVTGDHIIVIRADWLNEYTGMFIVSLLQRERFRYSYGRAYLKDSIKKTRLLLPITSSNKPNWKWMETFIKSLNHKRLTTKNTKINPLTLNHSDWKEFFLHYIMNIEMGNGIDSILTTNDDPKYNYVSRDSNGNGVVGFVDAIDGEKTFPVGAMSLALGGSFLGSCFIQKKPFYTAQNVAVLQEKTPLSDYTKLFIATLIRNECKIKYQAFGRELNAHIRKDFTLKLPIKYNDDGIVFDKSCEFSNEGYIPDWQWMENYIKSLPYSDRI